MNAPTKDPIDSLVNTVYFWVVMVFIGFVAVVFEVML
jgi:hypothetical protein